MDFEAFSVVFSLMKKYYKLLIIFIEFQSLNEGIPKNIRAKIIINIILCFFISLTQLPTSLLIFILVKIGRKCLGVVLLLLYGKIKFRGLLENYDALWAAECLNNKHIVTVLLLVDCESSESVRNKLKDVWKKLLKTKKYEKYSCIRTKKFGYYFWEKVTIDLDEHIREININKDSLNQVLEETIERPLPQGGRTNWEILIGNKSLESNNKNMLIPVIVKLHHSVGDAFDFQKILPDIKKHQGSTTIITDEDTPIETMSLCSKLQKLFYFFLIWPGYQLQRLCTKQESNILLGRKLTGQKTIAILLEKDYPIFQRIKDIKNRFKNVAFSDVVLTAMSGSLYMFMKKVEYYYFVLFYILSRKNYR